MPTSIIKVVALVCIQNDHLLLVRKKGTTLYMLPGGKIDPNEALEEALTREIYEELSTGLDEKLQFLGTFQAPAANEPGKLVLAHIYDGSLTSIPLPTAEIDHLIWHPLTDNQALFLAPLVKSAVLPYLKEKLLIPSDFQ